METDAIEKIYAGYSRSLYFYLFSLCSDRELAGDLLQETFVKAIVSLEASHGNVRAWLYRVGRNLYVDYLRKNAKMAVQSYESLDELPETGNGGNPETEVLRRQERREVREKVLQMPERFREILVLHYYCGLPQDALPQVLGMKAGAVRTLLHRAKRELKKRLEADET